MNVDPSVRELQKKENLKIGIFDSGMGGISVLKEMDKLFKGTHFIYYGDIANSPYGQKSKEEIIRLTKIACDYFLDKEVTAILLACNTATSASVKILRESYQIQIFGMEPAIKPAITENPEKKIAVLATRFTISEEKFLELGKSLNASDRLISCSCEGLASMIDQKKTEDARKFLKSILTEIENEVAAVVLGCTHYVLVREIIADLCPKLKIYDGNKGTTLHLFNTLKSTNKDQKNTIELFFNGGSQKDYEVAEFYLQK